jgi:hypothetical protein
MSKKDKFTLKNRGWSDGAGGRAMNPNCDLYKDYSEGYTAGRKARQDACSKHAEEYGVTNDEIMAMCLR